MGSPEPGHSSVREYIQSQVSEGTLIVQHTVDTCTTLYRVYSAWVLHSILQYCTVLVIALYNSFLICWSEVALG